MKTVHLFTLFITILASNTAFADPFYVGQPALSLDSTDSVNILIAVANQKTTGINKIDGSVIFEVTPQEGLPTNTVISPNGDMFSVVSHWHFADPNDWTSIIYRSRIDCYSMSSQTLLWSNIEDSGKPRSLRYSPDGNTIILQTRNPRNDHVTLKLINARTGADIKLLTRDDLSDKPSIEYADFYGNDKLVVSTFYGTVSIYDLATGSMLKSIELMHIDNPTYLTYCGDLKISPDLNSILISISASYDRMLFRVNLDESKVAWSIDTHLPGMRTLARDLAWPKGKPASVFAGLSSGNAIQEFDANSGQLLKNYTVGLNYNYGFRGIFVSDSGAEIYGLNSRGYIEKH